MRVLLVHNYYQQRGGEDASFEAEAAMLERYGHEVLRYTLHNDAVAEMHPLRVGGRTVWSQSAHRQLSDLIRRERPEVMHATNTFPLISPAAYHAAHLHGVAVVQSLRNYRLGCLNAQYLRNGAVCEKCLGKRIAWPGVVHGCYRASRSASAAVATSNGVHRALGTWSGGVDRYFTLTQFARNKSIEAGLPAERIGLKPNFLDPDPGPGSPPSASGHGLFVGRLSPEKGIDTLIEAWRMIDKPIELKVIGDGPMLDQIRQAAAGDSRITVLGRQTAEQVMHNLSDAACLVMPSIWYETFGRSIMEGFAMTTPAVVSDLGAMAELVEPGLTGRHFQAGNAADLAGAICTMFDQPEHLRQMGLNARHTFLERYTAPTNHRLLTEIYAQAIDAARSTSPTHGGAHQRPA